jgi:hypothetical protein
MYRVNKKSQVLLILFLVVSIVFGSGKEVCAAPTGGASLPPKGKAEIGYEYSLMYKRALEGSYGNLRTQDNFYTVSIGIFDWLCLDGKVGIGDVKQKGGIHLPKLEYRTGFAGGYGFRIKALDHPESGLRIIVGAQHISVHPKDRSIDNDKYESFLDDWQISTLISKSFKFITPYLGVKASDCEIVYNINKHDKKRRYSRYHIGMITGMDFHLLDGKVRINTEARFFDETGFSTQIAYLF